MIRFGHKILRPSVAVAINHRGYRITLVMRSKHTDAFIEMEFYGRPAGWPGQPPVRMAGELDSMELLVTEDVFLRTAALVDRLRKRTIGRRHYTLLRAIMVENAILTGQVDETEHVLKILAKHWRRCPARYLTWR